MVCRQPLIPPGTWCSTPPTRLEMQRLLRMVKHEFAVECALQEVLAECTVRAGRQGLTHPLPGILALLQRRMGILQRTVSAFS